MMRNGPAIFILFLSLVGGWSAPVPVKGPASRNAFSWAAYPKTGRMRLATITASVQPRSSVTMSAPLTGMLHTYVTEPQTNLATGFLWAEFEPGMFELEGKSLQEAAMRLDEREKMLMEVEYPRQKLTLERQIEDAERQLKLLQLLSTNPRLAQATMPAASVGGGSIFKPEALSKAQLELDLLKQSYKFLEATNPISMTVDIPTQRLDLQRRQLDFQHRRMQAQLKMPFPGQITVNLPLTEGVSEYPVNSGQELAVVRDLSVIKLRTALANPSWTSLQPERLSAIVRLASGEELLAKYAYQKLEKVQNREESVYYFIFSPNNRATATRLIGTDVACDLWYNLPEPLHVVPKLPLLLAMPDQFNNRTWGQGVSAAFPGAHLVVEGQTDLGIAK